MPFPFVPGGDWFTCSRKVRCMKIRANIPNRSIRFDQLLANVGQRRDYLVLGQQTRDSNQVGCLLGKFRVDPGQPRSRGFWWKHVTCFSVCLSLYRTLFLLFFSLLLLDWNSKNRNGRAAGTSRRGKWGVARVVAPVHCVEKEEKKARSRGEKRGKFEASQEDIYPGQGESTVFNVARGIRAWNNGGKKSHGILV